MSSLCHVAKNNRKYFSDDEFITAVGKKIREVRVTKGITIDTLSVRSDMSYSQLSRIELGQVNWSISFLPKIANALKVNVHELIPY